MDGVLIINKPVGKTSFDIVREVRKQYNTKKVGHIGTLDPLASGVLPVLIGKATKLSDYLMEHDKDYVATIQLGIQTDTGDCEGKEIQKKEVDNSLLNDLTINNVLNSFLGESLQIPPMYSAIKINGKKLYELARQGQTVERKPRKISISNISLLNISKNQNQISFKVTCSKGTYIRTLCEDISIKLGTCGYMKNLERTRVGCFKIEDSNKFVNLENIFNNIPKISISDYNKLKNGLNIPYTSYSHLNYSGFVNLYYNDSFIGIGKYKNQHYKRFILIDE